MNLLSLTSILNRDRGERISLGRLSSGNRQNNPPCPEKSQRARKKIQRKPQPEQTSAVAKVSQRGWQRVGVNADDYVSAEGPPVPRALEFLDLPGRPGDSKSHFLERYAKQARPALLNPAKPPP